MLSDFWRYSLLYVAKGGGSANKTQLLQQTKATLNDKSFEEFVEAQVHPEAAGCTVDEFFMYSALGIELTFCSLISALRSIALGT